MSNPTTAQVEQAFVRALHILKQLKKWGIYNPSVRLFPDGSGQFILGHKGSITSTPTQVTQITRLIGSNRVSETEDGEVSIDFCTTLFRGTGMGMGID